MLLLISAFLTSFDSLLVGFILGMNHIKISKINYVFMSMIHFVIILIGLCFYHFFNWHLFTPELSSLLYIFLAICTLFQSDDPKKIDKNQDQRISKKEAFSVAVSLSIDTTISALTISDRYFWFFLAFTYAFFTLCFFMIGQRFSHQKWLMKLKKMPYLGYYSFMILAIILYLQAL